MKVQVALLAPAALLAAATLVSRPPVTNAVPPATVSECVTVFGVGDCAGLEPPGWFPASCGTTYLFKNLWGKGKLPAGPKTAGVGYAGPVCWSGPPPAAGDFIPTTPGWEPDLDPGSKKNRDFEAVKSLGPCCLCCFPNAAPVPGSQQK